MPPREVRDPVTSPGYVALELAHVLAAVVGFGALGATGAFANAVVQASDPYASAGIRRFFRPGHNLASGAIALVPLLGGALLAAGHGQDVHLAYPWIGLGCWTLATSVAAAVIWPAERRLQRLLNAPEAEREPVARLGSVARRCRGGAGVTSLLFVVALVVMIAQP